MSKKWSLETTGKSYEQKFVCSDNLGQHFKQNNEINQNWKVVQNSNIWFCSTSWQQVIFLERRQQSVTKYYGNCQNFI